MRSKEMGVKPKDWIAVSGLDLDVPILDVQRGKEHGRKEDVSGEVLEIYGARCSK
jgi:hypothetical protein